MKMFKLFIVLLSGLFFLMGCGKPNEAESLKPDNEDNTGGYSIITKFATSGYAQDVVKKDSLLYIAQGEGGLIIVNVSDPQNPQTVSIISEGVRGYSTKIAMYDSVVYLAASSFGVTVLNVANPVEPVVTVANLSMKPAKNLHVMGDYLFTAISEQGVNISEISYPTQPESRSDIPTSGYARGSTTTADSNYLLVACGEMGLSIFDISDFQQGYGNYPRVGWCDTPGYAEAITILDDESLAFMACGTAGLQIVDYSDTSDVYIVGSFDYGGYAKELMYKNQRIYLTVELNGLQIIDVAEVTNPKLIGSLDTEFALGLDMDEKYVYVADEVEGLIIISIPD